MSEISHEEIPPLLVIGGPTASGKTGLALALAKHFPLEVISADSRQVYRGMDIGTAKATKEERALLPHHLIDVVDPDQEFTAADFALRGREAASAIWERRHLPALVGGTGLYIRAMTEGILAAPAANRDLRRDLLEREKKEGEGTLHRCLRQVDAETAQKLYPRDLVRIVRALEVYHLTGLPFSELQREHGFRERPFRALKFALLADREDLYSRIDQRVERMISEGLVEETRKLLERGYGPHLKALQTIGYREIFLYLKNMISLDEAVTLIQRETRRYAKRQQTWFRGDKSIIWVDSSREFDRILSLIDHFMQSKRSGKWLKPPSTFRTSI